MRTLFGTDGIRGKAHEYPLDGATMFALGEALGHRLRTAVGKPRILLGMDTRESGPEIARALTAGVAAGGGEAMLIGVIPTPGVAYLCRTTDAARGDLDLRVAQSVRRQRREDLRPRRNEAARYGRRADRGRAARDPARQRHDSETPLGESKELIESYERFLVSGVRPNALTGRKVVLDTGHGAAYRIAPDVFRRVGAEVVVIHDQPNGRNINEKSGAMHPERLAEVVVQQNADFGVAFDGDADRAIFVDDAGKIRDGDEIIYLWAQHLNRLGKLQSGAIVTTVMSNFGFEKQLKSDGIELLRAQVGDKYVLELMLENKAILGGEQSGHIIDLTVHTTGDGIHTALVFGEILAGLPKKFSQLRTFEPMPQLLLNQKVGSKPPLESLPKHIRPRGGESARRSRHARPHSGPLLGNRGQSQGDGRRSQRGPDQEDRRGASGHAPTGNRLNAGVRLRWPLYCAPFI